MRSRALLGATATAVATAALGLVAGPAVAGPAGGYIVNVTSSMYHVRIFQAPGETWTISTANLSAGGDTVIHVQNSAHANGSFIAGNDDYVGLASRVVVPPGPSGRNLEIFVRGYASWTFGTCDILGSSTAGQSLSASGFAFGGEIVAVESLALEAQSHIQTTPRLGGATDTVVLAVEGDEPWYGVGYDDDDGVDLMSSLFLPAVCGGGCNVVISADDFVYGEVSWLYDQDVGQGLDPDADRLGNGLESILGLNPNNADTDQDGIKDGDEILGVDDGNSPSKLNFPLYGANPTTKDIFVEVDWVLCDTTLPNNTCNNNPNRDQMTNPDIANAFVNRFLAFEPAPSVSIDWSRAVFVHADIGVTNTDLSTGYSWGNWGGANGQTVFDCSGLTPSRNGALSGIPRAFHKQISLATKAGAGPGQYCYIADGNIVTYAEHELGHTFGLQHGGRPVRASLNCKPNYVSPMNYGYEFDYTVAPTFSTGVRPAFNPIVLPEQGVPLPPNVITALGPVGSPGLGPAWDFKIDLPTQSVDWNRDGVFAAAGTNVRGMPTSTPFVHDCGGMAYGEAGLNGPADLRDASMAWQTVGGTVGDRLLVFGHDVDGAIRYVRIPRNSLLNCDAPITSYDENLSPDCAGVRFLSVFQTSLPATTRAVAAVQRADTQVLVVRANSGNSLWWNTLSTSDLWSGSTQLPGGFAVSGDPAILRQANNDVWLWAPSGGRLKRWTISPTSTNFSPPSDERWSSGSFVNPSAGIAVVFGRRSSDAPLSIFAAIPTTPNGNLVFARRNPSTGRWDPLAVWDLIGTQRAQARPGLAFVPGTGQEGRFWLSWNQPDISPTAPVEGLFALTEGNDANTSVATKRLKWLKPQTLLGIYGPISGGTALMFDPTKDTHLRAAARIRTVPPAPPNGASTLYFSPLADGIVNISLQDVDDYVYLRGAMKYALGQETTWPPGLP